VKESQVFAKLDTLRDSQLIGCGLQSSSINQKINNYQSAMPNPPARSFKDYLLPFLIIVSLGAVVVLSFRLWGLIRGEDTGSSFAVAGSASLNVVEGEVEAYLPAVEAWKIVAAPGAKVNPGERVRTARDGAAYLVFDDGSKVTLSASTELTIDDLTNALTKKTVSLTLSRGTVGVEIARPEKVNFTIITPFARVAEATGKYLAALADTETQLSVVTGSASAVILDTAESAKTPELTTLALESGETLTVTDKRVNLLRIGGTLDLVKETPAEIANSAAYLALAAGENLPTLATETAEIGTDLAATETAADTTETVETTDIADDIAAPVVTSPASGELTTSETKIAITGTVATGIAKIQVSHNSAEPYTLGQFKAGDKSWKYNASTEFANLTEGVNTYKIVALNAAGDQSKPMIVTVIYKPVAEDSAAAAADTTAALPTEAAAAPTTTTTDGVPAVGGEVAGAPTITEPAAGTTITRVVTKDAPVFFKGTVPAGTTTVEVNGYALTQGFPSGGTSWWYNAAPEYENLKIGANEYEIEAVAADGTRKSVILKIEYVPAE
jgi:hypothetical protein